MKICKNAMKMIDDIKLQIDEKRITTEDIGLENLGLTMIASCSIVDTHYIRYGQHGSKEYVDITKKYLNNTPKTETGLECMDYRLKISANAVTRYKSTIIDIEPVKIEIYDNVAKIIKKDFGRIIDISEVSKEEKVANVTFICSQKGETIQYIIRINIKFEREIHEDCSTNEKKKIDDFLCKEIYFNFNITK